MGLDRFAQSRKTASLKVKREIENSHADSRKRRTTQKKASAIKPKPYSSKRLGDMLTAKTMGKVKYATGIDYVSGSLSKPKKKDGHSCGTYLTGTHRTAASENPNCTRLYIREANVYDRTTPLSSKELDARARFTAVAAAVKARKSDLNKITQDQINFAAQKDTAGGKKTMKAYLWKVCGDIYDAAHQG